MMRPLVAIACLCLAAANLEAQQDRTIILDLEPLLRDAETVSRELAASPNHQAHLRGDEHVQAGNLQAALAEYETALEYTKDDQVAYWKIGSVYALMGRFEDAIERYEKSISVNDRGPIWPWGVYYEMGLALGQLGRFEDAEAALTESLTANPSANAYGARGRVKLSRNELAFEAALADYDAALRLDPNSIPALVSKAEALMLRDPDGPSDEDFENACAALIKICELGECGPLDEFSECLESDEGEPSILDRPLFEPRQ